jgi:acetoin utilization protein AcuB
MTKPIPSIQKYMTTCPHSIGSDQPLTKAHQMMRQYGIRHLPVLTGGKLVGIISDRDLKFVETFRETDPATMKVEDAFIPEPYTVDPSAPLDEVCSTMAEHKYGSVLVVQNDKLVGIFTWVDALMAFSDQLSTRLGK